MTDQSTDSHGSIAIIGMSGRFPGAKDLDEFWANLRDGVESIERFSAEEIAAAGIDPGALGHPKYVNAGAVLDDIELFDAGFFGYTPRESEIIDPQQRLFLECAWEAIERAGYDTTRYDGLIGVYGGVAMSRYLANLYANPELVRLVGGFSIMLANDKDHLTTRVAYKLDLKGPAVTVQTACSTSLVAVCIAGSALLDYSCDMALAGGASINVPQKAGYLFEEGGVASPDGRCRAFAADAAGTVAGNGVGVVLLKRLSDAEADGDNVLAVIRGFATNNDGALKIGYSAPSIQGQTEVIAMAQAVAGVSPETISYVEAHGTGTPLGDPIELAALSQVFAAGTSRRNFCGIGSVKTNIGHLDPAAGVAGLIKTVLALQHRQLPPTLHCAVSNPKLHLEDSPFYVTTSLTDWEATGATPRRAGVSSFGIGGTNAHVVVEEAPARDRSPSLRSAHVVLLSARTPGALDVATTQLVDHLQTHDAEIADVAYTTQIGRRAFSHRRALVCGDQAEAAAALTSPTSRAVVTGVVGDAVPSVALLFPGQGAQYATMARGLVHEEPVFAAEMEQAAKVLRAHLDVDLLGLLDADDPDADDALRQTAITQPALFVVEYALARLLMSWGIVPAVMLGHSIGEYVAACLADVFDLDQALALVAARGRLMQQLPPGAMMAVPLDEDALRRHVDGEVSIAAVNGPAQCVVSGPGEAVDVAERQLVAAGVKPTRLKTSHAFHSVMVEPAIEPFVELVRQVTLRPPRTPFVSNVTGALITDDQATDPAYWGEHLRRTVRFADGVRAVADGGAVVIEVGPGRTLSTLVQSANGTAGLVTIPTMRHPGDRTADAHFLAHAVARMWVAGVPIDWAALHAGESRRRVALPTYPFERQRHWVDGPQATVPKSSVKEPEPPVATGPRPVAEWLYVPTWRPDPAPPVAPRSATDRWLVFADDDLGRRLVGRLREAGQHVTAVATGSTFAVGDDGEYTIDPARRDHYATLLSEAGPPTRIVHLLGTSADVGAAEDPAARFSRAQRRGLFSLLALVQTLAERLMTEPIELAVVTSLAQPVSGDDSLRPEWATVLGPMRVVPQEYPNVVTRWVDLGEIGGGDELDAQLDQLERELACPPAERAVAFRRGRRFVPRFEQAASAESRPLRHRGVYLVTGAFGGLGWLVARHLASTVAARLVLVARTFPADLAARLRQLEEDGAEVLAEQADVADLEAMGAIVDRAEARFGVLNGVIHLAGRTGRQAAQGLNATDEAECVQHFQAKVHGVQVLDTLLAERSLDTVVLFSSLSTVLGGLGFVAYAAVNAFMDAFAHTRERWVSVDWDGWGPGAIGPAEGMLAFDRVVAMGPQIVVSVTDLQPRIETWVNRALPTADSSVPNLDLSRQRAEPAASPAEQARVIVDLFAALLGVEGVGPDDNFFALGGHSVIAIQLVGRLRDVFQVELSVEVVFDSATPNQLVDVIAAARTATVTDADELDEMLDVVESLTPAELESLLGEPTGSEAGTAPPPAGRANDPVRSFYDSVSSSLDSTEFGRHARFLNYGFVADGPPAEPSIVLPRHAFNRASAQLVLEVVGLTDLEDRDVVDVGCGRGGTLDLLTRHFHPRSSVGIDLSWRGLTFASAATNAGFCQGDAERLPLRDTSVDVVTNIESSHSYPDLAAFYREVHRVLRPGGEFLYADNLPVATLDRARQQLTSIGFVVERERDITANVLLSCDETAARRRTAFGSVDDASMLDTFLAVPGSDIYEELRAGHSRYVIQRWVRP